jgi:hypothetical protein
MIQPRNAFDELVGGKDGRESGEGETGFVLGDARYGLCWPQAHHWLRNWLLPKDTPEPPFAWRTWAWPGLAATSRRFGPSSPIVLHIGARRIGQTDHLGIGRVADSQDAVL